MFLTSCILLGLAGECLTLAATFLFILLCPCGPRRNSGKSRLWKTEDQLSGERKELPRDEALYTQKFRTRQLHHKWCQKLHYRGGMLQVKQLEIATHNAVADHLG